jgi:hypothetical protein
MQAAGIQRAPCAVGLIGALHPVPDRYVHVQVRVPVAADVMQEHAGDQAARLAADRDRAAGHQRGGRAVCGGQADSAQLHVQHARRGPDPGQVAAGDHRAGPGRDPGAARAVDLPQAAAGGQPAAASAGRAPGHRVRPVRGHRPGGRAPRVAIHSIAAASSTARSPPRCCSCTAGGCPAGRCQRRAGRSRSSSARCGTTTASSSPPSNERWRRQALVTSNPSGGKGSRSFVSFGCHDDENRRAIRRPAATAAGNPRH